MPSLFPLPLTSPEQFFVQDDYPGYPMTFFCRLRFQGRLERHALEEALRIAVARHPLLSAVVAVNKHGPHWLAHQGSPPPVEWLEQEPTEQIPPASFIDLRTRPGLQATAVVGAATSHLILQFHHAACDGIGAMDFTTDLLTAYANVASGKNRFRLKPLDVDRLRERGGLSRSGWPLFRWLVRRLPSVGPLLRFHCRTPAPLIPHSAMHREAAAPAPLFPETCVHHFSREESSALAALARGSESSLNALLVRDLFLALTRWRRANDLPEDDWLRLMVPINLRTPADRRLPAANCVSAFFVDHRASDGHDAEALLSRFNSIMADIKGDDLGLAWLLTLGLLQRWLPKQLEHVRCSRHRCFFTTVLTNLGPLLAASPLPRVERRLVVGALTLEHMEFIPVLRLLQCVGFAVSNYAGCMTLALRYDSRVLSAEQAKELLTEFVGVLRTSLQSPVCTSVIERKRAA